MVVALPFLLLLSSSISCSGFLPIPKAQTALSRALPPCMTLQGTSGPEELVRAAYVHLPFCRRRCYYCDFPIKVVGDGPRAASNASEAYVELLTREISATARDKPTAARLDPGGLTTVFFGGGTPSLTPPHLIKKVLDTLRSSFDIHPDAEICMEMDPGTFDASKLRGFLSCGVNRVSVGVQSFDAALLKACGRAHTLEDVHRAIETLKQEGVDNFSLDLMGGLPNQTMALWESSLEAACTSGANHISVYDLQVEVGTAFGRWYAPGANPLPPEEATASMYQRASQVLRSHGYEHYEVSNYARPGYQCLHNRVYWENRPYLAFGMGAASYLGGNRFSRPRTLEEYREWLVRLESEGVGKATGAEDYYRDTTSEQRLLDRLQDSFMLGLRLMEGVDLGEVLRHTDNPVRERLLGACYKAVRPYVDQGRCVLEGERLRLVDPEGFIVSNDIIATLFAALEDSIAVSV